MRISLVLLPGMDGSGALFAPLIENIPSSVDVHLISYPSHQKLSYGELVENCEIQLAQVKNAILIAESFSGPIALQLAHRQKIAIVAVVLAASFISSPISKTLSRTCFLDLALRHQPLWALRWAFLDKASPNSLLQCLQNAISQVESEILIHRIREITHLHRKSAPPIGTTPLLVLGASRDRLIRRTKTLEIAKQYPQAITHWIESSHLLLQCHPKQSMHIINTFMEKIGIFEYC